MEKSEYKSLTEWRNSCSREYVIARKNGWIKEICEIFGWTYRQTIHKNPKNYWTKEKCIEDGLKYDTLQKWNFNNRAAYRTAVKNGWIKEICEICGWIYKPANVVHPKNYWTKEKCIEDALKYNSVSEWVRNSRSVYGITIRNGWYEECTIHMVRIRIRKRKK
jgi:hypothetical protein